MYITRCFPQCMKKLTIIEDRIAAIAKKEAKFVCCSFKGECGMMAKTRCGIIFIFNTAIEECLRKNMKPSKISSPLSFNNVP